MARRGLPCEVFETQHEADLYVQAAGEGGACALVWKQARNSDFHELTLPPPTSDAMQDDAAGVSGKGIKIARCNGFRNIQVLRPPVDQLG